MAINRLGFGRYVVVDLCDRRRRLAPGGQLARDLDVFNVAGALPFAIAPVILVIGNGSYGDL